MRLQEFEGDPEKYLVDLWKSAGDYIWMSSDLNPSFYNRKQVKETIEETAERIGEFRILLGRGADWKERKKQLPWLADLIKSGRIKARISGVVPHWMVVDGKHFRIEKEHAENVTITKNLIIWDAEKYLADMIQTKFESWWGTATCVE